MHKSLDVNAYLVQVKSGAAVTRSSPAIHDVNMRQKVELAYIYIILYVCIYIHTHIYT